MALASYPAIQIGPCMVTGTIAHCLNQSCCSLTICACSTPALVPDGALTEAVSVTLWPGGTSAGRAMRWSVSQPVEPGTTKCSPRRTGLLPPAGQVELPTLVSPIVMVRVWLTAQLSGTALVSKVAAQEARSLAASARQRSGLVPS